METLLGFIISLVLGGLGITIVARLVPNFYIHGGFGSAVLIALVYGLLKGLLQGVLIFLSLPLVIVTLGLFIVAINGFLLWVTDKAMSRLEIRTGGALLAGTVLLSAIDGLCHLLLRSSALY